MPLNIQQPIFVILVLLGWQDPAFDNEGKEYVENIVSRFDKLGNIRDQAYFNYSPEENAEYSLGKKNLERLLTIKSKVSACLVMQLISYNSLSSAVRSVEFI